MALYHLHIDAMRFESPLREVPLVRKGFKETNFAHSDARYEHHEPAIHYTLKTTDLAELRTRFEEMKALLASPEQFEGYLEAEYIALDREIVPAAGSRGIPEIPFRATKRPVNGEGFRQSEIHVAMQTERPDAEICDAMREMGFFTAFMQKPYGLVSIFTLQGSLAQIKDILQPTTDFLARCPGHAHCTIKEERVVGWWLSKEGLDLPPVIDTLTFS